MIDAVLDLLGDADPGAATALARSCAAPTGGPRPTRLAGLSKCVGSKLASRLEFGSGVVAIP